MSHTSKYTFRDISRGIVFVDDGIESKRKLQPNQIPKKKPSINSSATKMYLYFSSQLF